jgi:hypothetical protein
MISVIVVGIDVATKTMEMTEDRRYTHTEGRSDFQRRLATAMNHNDTTKETSKNIILAGGDRDSNPAPRLDNPNAIRSVCTQ